MAEDKAGYQPGRDEDYLQRGLAAYFRSAKGENLPQPNRQFSAVQRVAGKHYVVLRRGKGGAVQVIRVYRIRNNDGVLKALKRWPKELDDA